MGNEQDAKLKTIIKDGIGYPFYDDQSRELNRLNKHIAESLSGILDNLRDEMCGNCDYSCNESNCDTRHNC